MIQIRHLLTGCALASCATVLAAQGYPQSPYATPYGQFAPATDADLLTRELRTLATDPTNLYALLNAAKLSLKLGDTDAAAALFTRAEKAAPGNPQVKAGMARLLVNAQRPGDALRLFAEAAQGGAGERDFGSDRALAYDLIGEQERAQREYRSLLRQGPDDETTRRYALSLGISGLKEPALALLEPLNRRSDRGAWRARAFVLAMNADRRGAETIATTMMPPGMADGLRPFFDRLPKLSAVDRAFAVHFGEVRGNAVRYADARRAPPLPALSPEPNPFPSAARATVQVAAAEPEGKKKKRKKDKLAPAVTRVAAQSSVAPLPPPPAPTALQLASLGSNRLPPPAEAFGGRAPSQRVTVLPPPADAYRPAETRLAANLPQPSAGRVRPTPAPAEDGGDDGPDEPVADAAPTGLASAASPTRTGLASSAGTALAATTPASIPQPGFSQSVVVAAPPPSIAPLPAAALPLAQTVPSAPTATALPDAPTGSAAIASFATSPTALPAPTAPAAEPGSAPASAAADANLAVAEAIPPVGTPPPPSGAQGDTVLAAILAGIKVPDAELTPAVPEPVRAAPLLTTVERKAETRRAAADAAVQPALPAKDRRGRYVDAAGQPLLDPRGRPLGPKGAAAWQAAQAAEAARDVKPPRKDARGRYLDARGKPLLDKRGRPLGEKAAVASGAQPEPAADDAKLPRKDARGRYLDARGRPLLDARGRPLGPKAAAAALLAANTDDAGAAGTKGDAKLPRKDARGRFLDAKGKPLLDARGRPLDAKAAAAKLAEAKKPEPAKGEPARFWVQVAGGANEDTLNKEWKRVSGATAALRGKPGWTTPLRATNRVLTGPYKSSAEAMAMVNQLKKQGVAAFMFTSDAGQKVTRLGAN